MEEELRERMLGLVIRERWRVEGEEERVGSLYEEKKLERREKMLG